MISFTLGNNRWRTHPDARIVLYSQIGVRMIDEITGRSPLGWIRTELDIGDGRGGWLPTKNKSIRTASGVFAYPGLDRRGSVGGKPPRNYRIRVEAEFYRPLFRFTMDGVEFEEVFPYNDTNAPKNLADLKQLKTLVDVKLAPAVNYPFPSHIPVLRGVVVDQQNRLVSDAEVAVGNVERVVTDEQGAFGLPVRWKGENVSFVIDATNHRTKPEQKGQIPAKLSADVGKNKIIPIKP